MGDTYGDGWNGGRYKWKDGKGKTQQRGGMKGSNQYEMLTYTLDGDDGTDTTDSCYTLKITDGDYPSEQTWELFNIEQFYRTVLEGVGGEVGESCHHDHVHHHYNDRRHRHDHRHHQGKVIYTVCPPCVDDAAWQYKVGKGCDWVAADSGVTGPYSLSWRCSKASTIDGDNRTAYEACPASCPCESSEHERSCPSGKCVETCKDDSTWTKRNKPSKGCEWVSKQPERRCNKKSDGGVKARDACQIACDSCP